MTVHFPRLQYFFLMSFIFWLFSHSLSVSDEYRININSRVMSLIEEERFADAEKEMITSGMVDPYIHAWLLLKQSKPKEGKALLAKLVTDATGDRAEIAIYTIGIVQDINVDDAIELCRQYLEDERFKNNPRIKLYLAKLYLVRKYFGRAKEIINEVLATSFEGEDLRTAMLSLTGELYLSQSSAEAMEYFEKLVEKVPAARLDADTQLLGARIAAAANRPIDALKRIDSVKTLFPEYCTEHKDLVHLSAGIAYEKLGDRQQAKSEFAAVIRLGEQDPRYKEYVDIAKAKFAEFERSH